MIQQFTIVLQPTSECMQGKGQDAIIALRKKNAAVNEPRLQDVVSFLEKHWDVVDSSTIDEEARDNWRDKPQPENQLMVTKHGLTGTLSVFTRDSDFQKKIIEKLNDSQAMKQIVSSVADSHFKDVLSLRKSLQGQARG